MSLQEKLDAQKQKLESAAPKQAVEIMHQATEKLEQSGIVNHVKTVGDTAPNFSLNNYNGVTVSLSQTLGQGPVVLGFFRGAW